MVFVKAVDVDVGSIVGYGGWVFPHVKQASIPWIGPADAKSQEQGPKTQAGGKVTQQPDFQREPDAIERLHALGDEDMQCFQYKVIPAGEPCMIVMGIAVAPAHQSRGVSAALSSGTAVDAYGKAGFEPVRVLHLDLDEYAPRPPRDNEPVMGKKGSGKWGHYVVQHMKREPREANAETM
ncbi:Acyl-CoA N-acyltransferase [Beauveria brongniartii RCEF 3172]|uniref:Acyl-CoA N-acyltransferase n=1 Tax=Beauveria brongniartii RCEF 3172 TaxID=1081107 RepID=A0A166YMH8_9HYPO|nr:Acyl-CoA N-acyltransferase [Beauveria brongniartii RCEF 3172]